MVIPYASNTTSKESSERYNDHGKLSTLKLISKQRRNFMLGGSPVVPRNHQQVPMKNILFAPNLDITIHYISPLNLLEPCVDSYDIRN